MNSVLNTGALLLASALSSALALALPSPNNMPIYSSVSQGSWDDPSTCSVLMSTFAGGNCNTTISCESHRAEYTDFTSCFVGGESHFSDPAIGDFSVEFTDVVAETLGNPMLRIKGVNDNKAFNVAEEVDRQRGVRDDPWNNKKRLCHDDPWGVNLLPRPGGKLLAWQCGIPKKGRRNDGTGLKNVDEEDERRGYARGHCAFHVVQYQKPDPSKDAYRFDVTLFDNNQDVIGGVEGRAVESVHGGSFGMTSKLPFVLIVEAGRVDDDAVLFKYGDQSWGSNDQEHHCDFGGYEDGNREGDCGFAC